MGRNPYKKYYPYILLTLILLLFVYTRYTNEGFQEIDEKLICGNAFKSLCKYNLDDRYELIPYDNTLKKGDTVFLKLTDIPAFLTNPPKHPLTLIIGNNDETFTDSHMNSLRQHAIRVYAVNSSAKGVYQIPMGFRDSEYTSHDVLYNVKNDKETPDKKDTLCLVNFILGTNESERTKAYNRFKNEEWVTVSESYINYNLNKSLSHTDSETKEKRIEYYRQLKRTKFVICPPGAGIDTHRVYETLYFGGVPIIKSSFLDPMYEKIGNCWIVNDWAEVSETRCYDYWNNLNITRPLLSIKDWDLNT